MEPLVISSKNLGAFAVEEACPRCLWIQLHVKQLPYQIFPGIFSSIDSYNKKVVHGYFDREGAMPSWLAPIGNVVGYVNPPSYHKFSYTDPDTGVTLRGEADGIFTMDDGSYTIVDYKTAKYTPNQESMLPVYQAQLNGYAYLGNRLEFNPVSQVTLIYMEPVTDTDAAASPEVVDSSGFNMALSATIVPVELVPEELIPGLLQKAKAIHELPTPPASKAGCKECAAITVLAGLESV